jgi:hypothetical protein
MQASLPGGDIHIPEAKKLAFGRTSLALIAGLLLFDAGCREASVPERPIEFPFQHPVAEEAREAFLRLEVYSEDDYRKLPRRDRYLWDVEWFEAEVMNGGVDQYFYNSTGDHAMECLEALNAIGAEAAYELLRRSCDLFPDKTPSSDREQRQAQLREVTGERHLDDLVEGEIEVDLYQRMMDYYHKADPKSM